MFKLNERDMSIKAHMKNAEYLVNLLENRFKFLGFRFGIDPLVGLLPGIGDFIPFVMSFYFIYIGYKAKIPKSKMLLMAFYSFLDWAVGTIPILGDIFDFFYHGHLKNYKILKDFVEEK